MAFQIKDFASISASAINWMRSTTKKVTDFNIGSVIRTLIEAVAAEIDELYQQMFIGLREAIPVSVYNSFDFAALGATSASGLIRVTVTSGAAVTIPAGTVFSVDGRSVTYASQQDVTIASGATYADVQVSATSTGVAGNLGAGSSFTANPPPDRFVSAQNLAPFLSGQDAETDTARKIRFNAFIASLNRGTVVALTYGLKLTNVKDAAGNVIERVVGTAIIEPWRDDALQPISLVQCYIHNGVGSTSSALVTRAREVIYGYYENGQAVPGWKAAGVKVEVFAATEDTVAVVGEITVLDGFDVASTIDQAEQVIYSYILGLDVGVSCLKAAIVKRVMEIPGVHNFTAPGLADEVTAARSEKLMPGAIAVTEA